MKRTTQGVRMALVLAAISVMLTGCASLQELTQARRPQAEITGLRLDRLDLQQLGLALELKVINPNSVGLNLSKLEYEFAVEGNRLFSGVMEQGLALAANSTRQLEIPITINPANLWQDIRRIAKQDRFAFAFSSVASFAVPLLGDVKLPLNKTGELPVLHTPGVKIAGLKRKALNLTGADLELTLQVENPNAFTLLLNQFAYDFKVNNRSWATGRNAQPQRFDAKQTNEIRIPISLNFLEMGTVAYQMLSSKAPLGFHFAGQFDFGSSEPFLKSLTVPVDYSSSVSIRE